jgi:hypothetical protein
VNPQGERLTNPPAAVREGAAAGGAVRLDQASVDHPPHYQANGVEAIDVIEAFGLDFNLGNAVKYLLRAGRKGDALTDLKKAAWYVGRAIAKLEAGR